MEIGLHIADYAWSGGSAALGPRLAQHAREAEDVGVTRITVMDHVWQMNAYDLGPYESDMLEAYSVLNFLAAVTSTVRLHTLVTAVAFRQPGLLAKQVSALDVLSGGRAGLGIGAGASVDESAGLGLPVPSTRERFELLEEAVQICLQMWSDSDAPFTGRHHRLERTLNVPQSLQRPHPYLLIGGEGEKHTLRLVAKYADACNIGGGDQTVHKLDVLKAHCEAVGRDYDAIEKTTLFSINPETTTDDILRMAEPMRDLGFSTAYIFAQRMPEPGKIIDVIAPAVAGLR
ncbi:LLM class F420-dependent oxidoreductase [Actinoplanes sp. M2I2]|uniref:LLM class F420-dependent oxidoreductase n=1 Tax=Actinoplanes sp. M2I2 TaxID=1734444 RepID=UPI0020217193|nr:LLM class F420-dependent oxidoreductase [Actinoplanes sp. M2I2]